MKKVLVIFLIALVTCESVEEEIELSKVPLSVVAIFIKQVQRAYNWLKEHGYLDLLKEKFESLGKDEALEACKKWFSNRICAVIVNQLLY